MPCDYNQLPHAGIRSLVPYMPGKSSEELAREKGLSDIIKLASNENPLGCSPMVTQALTALSGYKIATYPISANHPLRQKLADKLNVTHDMITLGNGSDSLFCSLLTCFALHNEKHILVHDCAFSSYAIQAHTLGIPVISTAIDSNFVVNIDAMINSCNEKTALIFLANPNNPTGLLIPHEEIKRLLDNIPLTTILVLDEAYFEYVSSPTTQSNLDLLKKHSNLVITRTFSKAYGLAGLRLGYAIANPQITALLYKIQLPFVVNITALTAGLAALDDDSFIQQTVQLNNQGIKQIQKGLTAINISYLPTSGNFITINCKTDAMPIYQGLQDYGIIVRPLHPYGLKDYLRVTIGTKEQNHRFLHTLSKELHHEK